MKMHEILFFFIIGLILYGLATLNFNLLLLFIIMCQPIHAWTEEYNPTGRRNQRDPCPVQGGNREAVRQAQGDQRLRAHEVLLKIQE